MQILADEKQVADLINRLETEVRSVMKASDGPWGFVGVRSRGELLAQRLAKRLKPDYHGTVDIALYRDDLSELGAQPTVRTTDINFPIDSTNILLVDDVLMSGRSVRAAIQSLIDFGRPRCIKLMVLVDRGGRELPIAPDFVGLRVNAEPDHLVEVRLAPTDPDDRIVMFQRPEEQPPREERSGAGKETRR